MRAISVLALFVAVGLAAEARAQAGIEAASITAGSSPQAPATPPAAPEPVRIVRRRLYFAGKVTGTVVERRSNAPVPGVILRLGSTEPEHPGEHLARSDSSGRYEFPNVEPGRWALVVVGDRLPPTFTTGNDERAVTVARAESVQVAPFILWHTACVQGHIAWSDGYVYSDATSSIYVAPIDPLLGYADATVNGVGDYELCSAPADSVMVWLVLRDGRRLGWPTRLAAGREARVDFLPDPLDQMKGARLQIQGRTPDGSPVPRAEVALVGRRFASGDQPMSVFTRQAVADDGGLAEVRLPYGTYWILVTNPRDGTSGRVEQLVIAPGAPPVVPQQVVLRDSSTPDQQARLRDGLLARGDYFLRAWKP